MINPVPLSSAAQAVLNAFGKHPLHYDNPSYGLLHGALPAALRAAADELDHPTSANTLYAIADELEAQ